MNDDITHIGNVKPLCPRCGAELMIEHDGVCLKGNERVLCPVHGDIGSLDEIRIQVFDQNREKIIDHTKELARQILKDSGFKLK